LWSQEKWNVCGLKADGKEEAARQSHRGKTRTTATQTLPTAASKPVAQSSGDRTLQLLRSADKPTGTAYFPIQGNWLLDEGATRPKPERPLYVGADV